MTTGTDDDRTARVERDKRRIEIAALVLLSIVPIVPYLVVVLTRGVPRFDLVADLAQMEYCTRRVWHGDTLLGLASRFHWSHPGPLLFYVLAPFQKMFGASSTGMYVGTCIVSAAAAGTTVGMTRALAGRAHGIAALVVVLAWLTAFGNIAGNPWVRVVVGLPLIACVATAALFARGASVAAIPAVFFGAIAAETHVSTVPTVGALGVFAVVSFAIGARRRGGLPRRQRLHLALAGALLFLVALPPLVEEVRLGGDGNLSRLVSFFRHREVPYKSFDIAVRDWVHATSWLPDRAMSGGLVHDTGIPFAMRWEQVPGHLTQTAQTLAVIHVATMMIAAIVARVRRDTASLALLAFAGVSEVLAIFAIRAIVGEEHYSLLFWTTAPSSVGWIGVVGAFGGGLAGLCARAKTLHDKLRRLEGSLAIVATFALGAMAFASSALQREWLAVFPQAPASDPWRAEDRRKVYELLRAQTETPVLHFEGGWGVAMAMVLEADKDGVDFRLADRDLWGFPGARAARSDDPPRVKHIWFSEPPDLVPPVAKCLEVVANVGQITVLASPKDVRTCRD